MAASVITENTGMASSTTADQRVAHHAAQLLIGNAVLFERSRYTVEQTVAYDPVGPVLSEVVSLNELATMVNMSSSAFHKKFKEVMHLSPLQYAKRVKLNKAQAHILHGRSVSEAGYMVGYNSPAQFSRE